MAVLVWLGNFKYFLFKGSFTTFSFYASVQRVLFFLTPYPKAYCINADDTYGYTVSQGNIYIINAKLHFYDACLCLVVYYFDAFQADAAKEGFLYTTGI